MKIGVARETREGETRVAMVPDLVGKLTALGAEVLVSGTLYRKADNYELFLKLVRVSSAEILSVTKARVDQDLGL